MQSHSNPALPIPQHPSISPLSRIDHTLRVPPNVKFEVDDAEEPWTFQEKFDVVHARYLAAAIVDWPRLMRQAFEFTKPGGWAEFQDYDLVYYSEDGTMGDDREFCFLALPLPLLLLFLLLLLLLLRFLAKNPH